MAESGKILQVAELGLAEYSAAIVLQDVLVGARRTDEIGDTLLLLEHPHVFTLGRGADERFLITPPSGIPIHRISRGGQVTYHGPGQLIGYPIVKLEGRDRDVHRYLRTLEQVIIDALAAASIEAGRRDGLTGVWVGPRKIASIGVGIRRWVTFHGFAVNVAPDLSYFDTIVPCGIDGCRMTSIADLNQERGGPQSPGYARMGTLAGFSELIQRSFAAMLGYREVHQIAAEDLWERIDPDHMSGRGLGASESGYCGERDG